MADIRISSKIRNNAIYILCFFSFLAALFYNELNLQQLPSEFIREGGTVITSDDASYLNPPRNFLKEGIWGEHYAGNIGRFIRPPGYGLICLPFLYLFNDPVSITALKIFQYLLFAVSVFWFFRILLITTKHYRLSFIVASLYGLSPFNTCFLSYTLTEGITPSLLLFYVFLLVKSLNTSNLKESSRAFYFAAFVFAILFIIRPVLGIFGLLLPVLLIYRYRNEVRTLLKKLLVTGLIAASLMLVWQIRNYRIAGQYVGLHPIYYADGNTIYRQPFREYWNFAGCWAERGDKGFSYMIPMWNAAIQGDTSIKYIDAALKALPDEVLNHFGKERLTTVFRDYQSAVLDQKYFYDRNLPMLIEQSASEKKSEEDFIQLTKEYKKEFPFQYYIASPVKVFALLAFHSNLSLYMFQVTFRGMAWMEALRWICYLLHSLCFLFIFVNMFRIRREFVISMILGWLPFLYLFYLCFFQRGVEERYTQPVLPLLMIGLVLSLQSFGSSVFGRKN